VEFLTEVVERAQARVVHIKVFYVNPDDYEAQPGGCETAGFGNQNE
jgi:hypothetical protein